MAVLDWPVISPGLSNCAKKTATDIQGCDRTITKNPRTSALFGWCHYTCAVTCICTCTHVYIQCTCVYMYMFTCMHVYMYLSTHLNDIHATFSFINIRTWICMTCVHVHGTYMWVILHGRGKNVKNKYLHLELFWYFFQTSIKWGIQFKKRIWKK